MRSKVWSTTTVNQAGVPSQHGSGSNQSVARITRFRRSVHTCGCVAAAALALSLAGLAAGCGGRPASQPWTSANGSVASQRAVTATALDARTIPRLKVRWRFRLHANVTAFGAITSNPIIRGSTVYLQDSTSSVYALDVRSGALLWKHTLDAPNDGPNGLTIS